MIVVSLLLILLSGGMLATGILNANDVLVLASIGVSMFAAAALFLGIRQQRAQGSPTADDDAAVEDDESAHGPAAEPDTVVEPGPGSAPPAGARSSASRADDPIADRSDPVPDGVGPSRASDGVPPVAPGAADLEDPDDLEDLEDPADEPPAELLLASEEETLSHRDDEVLVVDGRPRYHLTGCPHLSDKASEPLPVGEAVELGFTPCSRCAVATTLLGAVSS